MPIIPTSKRLSYQEDFCESEANLSTRWDPVSKKKRKEGGKEGWRANLDLIMTACRYLLLLEIARSKMSVMRVTEVYSDTLLPKWRVLNELHCTEFNFEICLIWKRQPIDYTCSTMTVKKGKILTKGICNTKLLNQATLEEQVVLWYVYMHTHTRANTHTHTHSWTVVHLVQQWLFTNRGSRNLFI